MLQTLRSSPSSSLRIPFRYRCIQKLRIGLSLALAMSVSGCSSDFSVEPTEPNQNRFEIETTRFGTPTRITVTLPKNHDATGGGTHILLLHVAFDQESYDWTREIVDALNARQNHPKIIIGSLEYIDGAFEFGVEHDQAGASQTLEFIKEDLLPFLREKYRIDRNIVFSGWSRFGRFATFALAREPELFDGFIIRSSAPSDAELHDQIQAMFDRNPNLNTVIHRSIGTEGNELDRRPVFESFSQLLRNHAPSDVRWKSDVIEGAGHAETFSSGLRSGLSFYLESAGRR